LTPESAYRLRAGDDEGTPLPPETPQGENPPVGAPLDYVLMARASTPVVLTIADAGGRVVRRYASDDVVKKIDPATLDIPAFWNVPDMPPRATPGMHRRYRARLTVDGTTLERQFDLRRDPRGTASDDDLREQYALASDVEALRSGIAARLNAAVARGAAESEIGPLRDSRDALVELYTALESGDAAPSSAQRVAYAAQSAVARRLLTETP
jgi:hypothetical protein